MTRELADAAELAEVEGMSRLSTEAMRVAGGIAIFAGPDSPLTGATGIGLSERAGEVEADAVLGFFAERGGSPRLRVSPYADKAFVNTLAARGCVPIAHENLMVADLLAIEAARDSRVETCREASAWADASALAFKDGGPSTQAERAVPLMFCTIPHVTALEIRVAGDVAATGCMDVNGEIAGFFAASTMVAHRGAGLQTALILDRIARGRERGARVGRVTTRLGTISEQNFRRVGFVPLYTRTIWGMP